MASMPPAPSPAAAPEQPVGSASDGLPDGDYAVRAFHDLNGDGKMNTNPFGMPVEPDEYSQNAGSSECVAAVVN